MMIYFVLMGTKRGAMRKTGLALICLLAGCVPRWHGGVRPLQPLEVAASSYSDRVIEEHTGSLMYEGGCLLFREDGGANRLHPIWPAGSIFNGTSIIFHSPGRVDQPILIAQHVVLGGERFPWAALSHDYYAPFRHQCGAEPFVVSEVRPAD
jgi:hypothetical protein